MTEAQASNHTSRHVPKSSDGTAALVCLTVAAVCGVVAWALIASGYGQ